MADRIITVTDPSIVTNDTLLGYNNYSDIDGQLGTTMTPTEATNGKTITLSDGVVHEVTTKPVGTTNGEFSAVVSNAVTVDLSSSEWTLDGSVYDSKLADVSAQTTIPTGLCFKPDGLKMYVQDNVNKDLLEYDLSVAWDVSTAVYLEAHAILTGTTQGLAIASDGLNMLHNNQSTTTVYSRTLATPWEFTTGIGNNVAGAIGVSARSLFVSEDGLGLWFTTGTDVQKWTFGTAWDASTLTSDAVSLSLTGIGDGIYKGLYFSDTGTRMFVANDDSSNAGANSKIFQYDLSTPWDITTATISSNTLNVALQDDKPLDIFIKPDGTKLYVCSQTVSASVYQYSMG